VSEIRSRCPHQMAHDLTRPFVWLTLPRVRFLPNHHFPLYQPEPQVPMKSYIDRGVQAGSFLLQSRTLALDAEFLASSPEDLGYAPSDPRLLSPPFHASPAYSHSPVNGSPILKTEVSHAAKPRKLPQMRPSTNRHTAIRVFSLPEDSATGKLESNIVQRVVSMPEQRPAGGQLADSSVSTEGFEGSMLSGGSFLSGTDTTSGRYFFSHDLSLVPHRIS
jgi:hypothetical protein